LKKNGMEETRKIPSEQNARPVCWLCGDPVPVDQADHLLIDDAYQVLHPDCGERVKKSTDV